MILWCGYCLVYGWFSLELVYDVCECIFGV